MPIVIRPKGKHSSLPLMLLTALHWHPINCKPNPKQLLQAHNARAIRTPKTTTRAMRRRASTPRYPPAPTPKKPWIINSRPQKQLGSLLMEAGGSGGTYHQYLRYEPHLSSISLKRTICREMARHISKSFDLAAPKPPTPSGRQSIQKGSRRQPSSAATRRSVNSRLFMNASSCDTTSTAT